MHLLMLLKADEGDHVTQGIDRHLNKWRININDWSIIFFKIGQQEVLGRKPMEWKSEDWGALTKGSWESPNFPMGFGFFREVRDG